MKTRPLVGYTVTLLTIGLAVLLGIVALSYYLSVRSSIYFDDVIAARNERTAAVEMRNALLAAESSQRGFLFSGNEIYLAPYDTAKVTAQRHLANLSLLLSGNAHRQDLVARLKIILDQKASEMDETIALKRAGRDEDASAVFRTNSGKALMDEANVFLSAIILDADDRLTEGVAEQRSNSTWLRAVTLFGGVAIVLVVGFATAAVVRYTRELSEAHKELGVLNEGLEERVRERTRDLIQANEEIQRFAYIVTHDLRAPLVNIMGFTSEVEDGVTRLQSLIDHTKTGATVSDQLTEDARIAATEDLPEAIGFIRSSTKKMDGLINAILKLSREGGRKLRPEAVDLRQIVEASAENVRHAIQTADGDISVKVSLPPIAMDRMALEQVVGNLIDNAVKYRSPERPLRISITGRRLGPDRIELRIEDNGRGIAEADLERVFELFRRAGTQDQPGEGMGLSSVRAILRRLGGSITLNSALDRGTTFTLVLPTILRPEISSAGDDA